MRIASQSPTPQLRTTTRQMSTEMGYGNVVDIHGRSVSPNMRRGGPLVQPVQGWMEQRNLLPAPIRLGHPVEVGRSVSPDGRVTVAYADRAPSQLSSAVRGPAPAPLLFARAAATPASPMILPSATRALSPVPNASQLQGYEWTSRQDFRAVSPLTGQRTMSPMTRVAPAAPQSPMMPVVTRGRTLVVADRLHTPQAPSPCPAVATVTSAAPRSLSPMMASPSPQYTERPWPVCVPMPCTPQLMPSTTRMVSTQSVSPQVSPMRGASGPFANRSDPGTPLAGVVQQGLGVMVSTPSTASRAPQAGKADDRRDIVTYLVGGMRSPTVWHEKAPQALKPSSTSAPPLPPQQQQQQNVELQEGAWFTVGTRRFKILRPLGMGSFGAVWAIMENSGGQELAVKEILCNSEADLCNALFEGHLLRTFAQATGQATLARLPSLIECETLQLSAEMWRVRLVMTQLPGEPLDTHVKRRQRQQQHEEHARNGAHGDGSAESLAYCQEAFHLARELLLQLVPAFEQHVAGLAYHRDVNAHNILIDRRGNVVRYGLVDFGLAVDVSCWHGEDPCSSPSRPSRVGQDGASSWHQLDVGGDCRYWPVSAWVQFLLGWTEVEATSTLRREYVNRLDLHSLGLTALQVLVDLLPASLDMALSGTGTTDFVSELFSLRSAWERYWAAVTPLHRRLMETFHTAGDWDTLKTDCLDASVHHMVQAHLRALRASMSQVRAASERLPSGAGVMQGPAVASLMTALLALVCSGDGDRDEPLGLHVEVPGPTIWKQILTVLKTNAARMPPRSDVPLSAGGRSNGTTGQGESGERQFTHLKGRVDRLTQEMTRFNEDHQPVTLPASAVMNGNQSGVTKRQA